MIQIRSYQPGDTQQIIDLILPIQQLEFKVPITIEQQPDLFQIPEVYQQAGGNFWVAVNEQQQIVGSIALIDCGQAVGCIRKMFVKKEYRGAAYGIAAKLLQYLEAHALMHGIEQLYLGTITRLEAAVAFYKKNGFNEIAKQNLPSVFPIMAVDNLFFCKILDQSQPHIINYQPRYAKEFLDINIEWISVNFTPEPQDYHFLLHPEKALEQGGKIFLLREQHAILGTAALLHLGEGVYELAKMAVRPQAKGKGYGKLLCQYCIDEAKRLGAKRFFLESNRKQTVAIIMYQQLGFVEVPISSPSFDRVDIEMEYPL